MFYSAIINSVTRKTDALDHQGDPAYWVVIPCASQGWALHFALLNEDTGPFGRIISALTGSGVYHAELWLDESVTDEDLFRMIVAADFRVGLQYDYEGALLAWKDSGYHTFGKEFCSGMAYKILSPVLPGLQPYPNPGKLLSQVTGMLGLPMPKLAVPEAKLTDADFDYLDMLHAQGKVALGINQQVYQELQA
jgi:hypothetical protein